MVERFLCLDLQPSLVLVLVCKRKGAGVVDEIGKHLNGHKSDDQKEAQSQPLCCFFAPHLRHDVESKRERLNDSPGCDVGRSVDCAQTTCDK
jgi:hypothetical protein